MNLVNVLIYLIVLGGIAALVWWLLGYLGAPRPVMIVAAVIFCVLAILILVSLLPGGDLTMPRLR